MKLIVSVLHVCVCAVCVQENICPECPCVSVCICKHKGSLQT